MKTLTIIMSFFKSLIRYDVMTYIAFLRLLYGNSANVFQNMSAMEVVE